jgi:hypothetical protein
MASIRKTLWVRRSDAAPALYWWSLPLSLDAYAAVFADDLAATRALVLPRRALAAGGGELGALPVAPDVALVPAVPELLRARAAGRVGPCSIAIFPPSRGTDELERLARELPGALERAAFTLAVLAPGDGGMQHRFAFRVPGKVIAAIEALALERRFGGNPGQVEMALLQGLNLRPAHRARLTLVLADGGATLQGVDRAGRRRRRYLESGMGYTGTEEDMTLRSAVGERLREAARRFPIGVVMFVGLPFFIAAFWARHGLLRRGR